jgi:hypothetical protein
MNPNRCRERGSVKPETVPGKRAHQYARDEVPQIGRQRHVVRESILAADNPLRHLFGGAIGGIGAVEGQIASHHLVQNHTARPAANMQIVTRLIVSGNPITMFSDGTDTKSH